MDNTMIVFTSDHGDYLGDHWLGEKELFHEPSVKVPLIIYDPTAEADAARGTVCDELVESIDLAPTFLAAVGADPAEQAHRLEGRSLLPFLRGAAPPEWRRFAISEYDYSMKPHGQRVGRRAARRALVHGLRPALEIHPRRRLPADAVRPRERSRGIARPRRAIRPIRPSATGWQPRSTIGACAFRSGRRCRTPRSVACAAKCSGAAF